MKSEVLDDPKDMLRRIDWRTEVVGVDEANFMGPGLIEIAGTLADSGKQVIIAGLDTDYMGASLRPHPGPAGPGRIHHENFRRFAFVVETQPSTRNV